MKNKGQALVLFVLLLPIMILTFSFIIDIGYISVTKKKIDNTAQEIIKNSLENNLSEEETKNLIIKNIDNVYIRKITIVDNEIDIEIKVTIKAIFSSIKKNTYEKNYKVVKQENEIKIRK